MSGNIVKKTILIVEDDVALQNALVAKFVNANFFILTAQDGEEGLKIALERHPDVITVDILMPKKNGTALMDDIRNDPWGKSVPIIVLTNLDANDKMLSTVIKDQPSYYLIKSNTRLEDLVNKVIELTNSIT